MSINSKVSVVGAGGNVGGIVAYSIAMQGLAHQVVLVDRDMDRARGKALDMNQAAAAMRSHSVVRVAESYEDVRDSKIVVITAGFPRKEGMSRDDLLIKNAEIMREVVAQVKVVAPDSILIIVSNPLDAMTYVALKESGFPKERVIGMAGILDIARMTHFIQEKLGFGAGQIRASVIGGHGDTMVLLPRFSTVAGVPLHDLLSDDEIEEIVMKTKHGGAEIVKYLGTSAYLAPGKGTAIMIESILRDSKKIYSCSTLLDGDYGYTNVTTGVPVMLGANGAERIIKVTLDRCEKSQFDHSVKSVQNIIEVLYKNNFFGEEKYERN
ncbi:malate dehydrogenase [Sulfurospirillum sp. 1612]|uniref:malate dehydrogenase n=1 Tax=Sulfurospirillum sp. 1612 TaxID=3094835 RepID=UPI002F93EECF